MYNIEICSAANVTAELCDGPNQLLIGGGGEMWGEYADTSDLL